MAFNRFKKWSESNYKVGFIPTTNHYIVITVSFCLLDNLERYEFKSRLSWDEAVLQVRSKYKELELLISGPESYSCTVVKTRDEVLNLPQLRHFRNRKTGVRAVYSEYLGKHGAITENGIIFEDGIYYSYDELKAFEKNLPREFEIKMIHTCKTIFGGSKVI